MKGLVDTYCIDLWILLFLLSLFNCLFHSQSTIIKAKMAFWLNYCFLQLGFAGGVLRFLYCPPGISLLTYIILPGESCW